MCGYWYWKTRYWLIGDILLVPARFDGAPAIPAVSKYEWEQFVLAAMGSSTITNISQITPEGDLDGDGASNLS